ncbi:MAG: hypothetical protein K1X83_01215 [Oligoflexia bacterium]|nr:hypothetical protein [Oligoflexia bacterium]
MRCLFGIFISFLVFPGILSADFVCKSQLSYKWKKEKAEQEETVEVGLVEASGKDQAQVKARLEDLLPESKTQALQNCKKEHESVAECLADKFASMASVLNSMRFEARKSLEQAISADCEIRKGLCTTAASTEIVCAEKISEAAGTPTPAAAAGKEAKKK